MKQIPKVIHYCWFGKNPLPELTLKCIESWKKYLPDYQIIEWNENNFDVNICPYVKEAYEASKFAFVSDYARFYILYNYGGIYIDVDVEVIKPIDKFLEHEAFAGFESKKHVAPGLILGAKKGNKIIKEILDSYSNRKFLLDDGNFNLTTVVEYTTDVLLKYGLKPNNSLQNVNEMVIYPKTYFCPLSHNSKKQNFSENTYTIHHYAGSWLSEKQRKRNNNVLWKFLVPFLKFIKRLAIFCFGENGFTKIKHKLRSLFT